MSFLNNLYFSVVVSLESAKPCWLQLVPLALDIFISTNNQRFGSNKEQKDAIERGWRRMLISFKGPFQPIKIFFLDTLVLFASFWVEICSIFGNLSYIAEGFGMPFLLLDFIFLFVLLASSGWYPVLPICNNFS